VRDTSRTSDALASTLPRDRRADWLATVLIAAAFALALQATAGLTWPPRWDFYRELGSIQAVLDGRAGADPLYLGERRWYNPLIPQLMAWGSAVTRVQPPEFIVRSGPLLNLLGPIGFYLLGRRLVGRWPAVLGLTVYLFWPAPYLPENSAGTYSGWAWPRNVAQGPCFLAALALVAQASRDTVARATLTGVLIGVTFLTHTAPALMLGLAAVFVSVARAWRGGGGARLRPIVTLAVAGGAALIVSAPYWWPLLDAYQMRVQNRSPMNAVGLSVRAMAASLLSVRFSLAAIGAWAWWTGRLTPDKPGPSERLAGAMLLLACLCWLGWGVVYQLVLRLTGVELLQVVPEYHFHLYLKAFEALLAGAGALFLAQRAASRLAIRRGTAGVAATTVLAVVLVNVPSFRASAEQALFREESIARMAEGDRIAFHAWALAHTRPEDVFLTDDRSGLFVVSPTGRKVVAIYAFYSNPYVRLEPRVALRDRLFEALESGDYDEFARLARAAGVTHVLLRPGPDSVASPLPVDRFPLLFAQGDIRVHGVPAGRQGSSSP
jgi:hypothetical protein